MMKILDMVVIIITLRYIPEFRSDEVVSRRKMKENVPDCYTELVFLVFFRKTEECKEKVCLEPK